MSEYAETRFTELYGIAKRAGSMVAHNHSGYVTREDMVQEGMFWLLSHQDRVEKATDLNGNLYLKRVYHMVLRYLIPKARQARAALYGAPSDDQKYSTRTIRALLPALWSDEHAERPESEIRSHSDPAIGGNWTPMTVDVHKAFQLIGTAEQAILLLRYGLGDDWRDIAAQSCSSESAVRLRADRAITQMADHLNGLDERLYPFEPVGTRRTQSNARARFSTDAVYNGEGV